MSTHTKLKTACAPCTDQDGLNTVEIMKKAAAIRGSEHSATNEVSRRIAPGDFTRGCRNDERNTSCGGFYVKMPAQWVVFWASKRQAVLGGQQLYFALLQGDTSIRYAWVVMSHACVEDGAVGM
jgi:hypothetical protein